MNKREDILRTAYAIVGQDGLEALHARSVAAKVGINHAAVHYYFRTRHDLLIALLRYAKQQLQLDRENLSAMSSRESDRWEAEWNLVEAYCRPQSRMIKVWASLFVAAQSDEVLRLEFREFWRDWAKNIDEAMRSETASGRQLRFSNGQECLAMVLGLTLSSHLMESELDYSGIIDFLYSEQPRP